MFSKSDKMLCNNTLHQFLSYQLVYNVPILVTNDPDHYDANDLMTTYTVNFFFYSLYFQKIFR